MDADLFKGVAVTWNGVALGGLLDINGPSETMETVDNTDADSSIRTVLASLHDGGEVSMNIKFVADDAAQIDLRSDMRAGTERVMTITWTDGGLTVYTFNAICTAIGAPQGSVGGRMEANVTFKVNSIPVES